MGKLNLEDLAVESFATTGDSASRGTVHGRAMTDYTCAYTCEGEETGINGGWTCQNTCNHVAYPECRFALQTDEPTCCRSCAECGTVADTPASCQYSCTA